MSYIKVEYTGPTSGDKWVEFLNEWDEKGYELYEKRSTSKTPSTPIELDLSRGLFYYTECIFREK